MSHISKTVGAAAVIALSAISTAQVKEILYSKGKPRGSVTISAKVRPSGNLAVNMKMTAGPGQIQLSELFAPSGMPVQENAIGSGPQGKIVVNIVFGATSAEASMQMNGKTRSTSFPYPKGANLKQRDNFWFLRDHPKAGAKDSYTELDLQTLKWKNKMSTYVGDEKIKYHGRLVNAHKVDGTEDITWVDDAGLPYRSQDKKTGDLLERT